MCILLQTLVFGIKDNVLIFWNFVKIDVQSLSDYIGCFFIGCTSRLISFFKISFLKADKLIRNLKNKELKLSYFFDFIVP